MSQTLPCKQVSPLFVFLHIAQTLLYSVIAPLKHIFIFFATKVAIICDNLLFCAKKIMIYGYIRVSSDKQTVENQRFEINKFCEREKMKVDGWIEETISGTKAYNKRQLGVLLKRVEKWHSFIIPWQSAA